MSMSADHVRPHLSNGNDKGDANTQDDRLSYRRGSMNHSYKSEAEAYLLHISITATYIR